MNNTAKKLLLGVVILPPVFYVTFFLVWESINAAVWHFLPKSPIFSATAVPRAQDLPPNLRTAGYFYEWSGRLEYPAFLVWMIGGVLLTLVWWYRRATK